MIKNNALKIVAVSLGIFFMSGSAIAETNTQEFPFRDHTLPIDERVSDLMQRLTLREKTDLLWELAPPIERLDIPKYYHGNEALHGVVRPGNFTVFPQAIAFGATFNPELILDVATAISDEARGRWNELDFGAKQTVNHSDLLSFWSPNINMARDPRWGRTAGTYGEDPWLASRIAVSFVRGLQGDDPNYLKVVSTPKHYVANNVETNRVSANSIMSERSLREYYLPAFKAAVVEGGAHSIMSSYNAVNYVPANGNRWLLTDLLRDQWGFDGYVVSDCGGSTFLSEAHTFAPSQPDGAAAAYKAGMDLACHSGVTSRAEHLVTAYERGLITMEEIDTSVYRVLRARFKLGMFDPVELNPYNKISPDVVGSPKHQELALELAKQSLVLLENQNEALPLDDKKIKSIAVVGHNADKAVFGDYSGTPVHEAITPLMGLRDRLGSSVKINYVDTRLRMTELVLLDSKYTTTPDGQPGLLAEYFDGFTLSGEPQTRVDEIIDLHSVENPPDPFFKAGPKSVRWTGYITGPESALYDLGVASDDGVRVWIDDVMVFDEWRHQGENLFFTQYKFEKDRKYSIRVEWYDAGGDAAVRLLWAPVNRVKDPLEFAEHMEAAKSSDAVIAVIGTDTKTEAEGRDKTELDLPGNQLEMLKAVHSANENLIVVLVTGSQHTIPWIKENAKAIVNAWYPGEQGGTAIAQALFGDFSPAGRTPLTYYESVDTIPEIERYEVSEGRTYQYYSGEPLWHFGHGLSYTSFSYSKESAKPRKDNTQVRVTVRNDGKFDSDEVVQVYASFPESKVANRPNKKLVGFQRVHVKAGKSKKVSIDVRHDQLSYWSSIKRDWILEPTSVRFHIGASSDDIRRSVDAQY